MNKQELSAMIAQILEQMKDEPQVKGSDYRPTQPGPEMPPKEHHPGQFVEDVSAIDLRQLYLTKDPKDGPAFARLKTRTPARLGMGRAGARYKTLTQLRFRADHAAARDAVFSQVPEDFGENLDLVCLQTKCESKDQYLTRPDLGRCFSKEMQEKLRREIPSNPRVQIVIGDGLSSAAVTHNAPDCAAAIRDGLTAKGIETGKGIFVRYCRVGAGDAIGDVIGCDVVCMLVGERPGLVTDKSMSAYITYQPHTGVSESSRTVVSNIHAQGTPAVEAGAFVADLIAKILEKKVSGVGLTLEGGV